MNETTQNLWKALEQYQAPVAQPVVHRLIYDPESGKALTITVNETDQPCIIISREEADRYPHQDPRVRVVDGKIVRQVKKMQPVDVPNFLKVFASDRGTITTDDYSMLIIDDSGKNRWCYD